MTEEKIKEFISKELEKYADNIVAEHIKEIEQKMKNKSKETIVKAMEECRIYMEHDDRTTQTIVRIDFGRF